MALGYFKHLWITLQWLGCQHYSQMVTSLSLEVVAQVFQEFSKFTRFVVGDGERIRLWEDIWWGVQPLGSQYPRLFR